MKIARPGIFFSCRREAETPGTGAGTRSSWPAPAWWLSRAGDAYPRAPRSVALENARTLPLDFAAPPPPPITCAELGTIKAPTAVVGGALTPPFFRIIADTASHCIHGSRLIVVPNTRHLWPAQEPAAFNRHSWTSWLVSCGPDSPANLSLVCFPFRESRSTDPGS